jgi:hypothetical protein
VAVLLISNIASTKIVLLWKFTFDGGTLLFPLSYIFGDILTEVYGYSKARRVIWAGFAAALLMSIVLLAVNSLPAPPDWPFSQDFQNILGLAPRIVLASLIAYLAGEFSNSFVLAKIKIKTKGKFFSLRAIASTLAGQAVDTAIFVVIAFGGVVSSPLLLAMIVSNYVFKCLIEVAFLPLTSRVVVFLKIKEKIDAFDYHTNFNPFYLKNKE